MFSFFETSFLFFVPVRIRFSLLFVLVLLSVLKEEVKAKGFLALLSSHYSSYYYPRVVIVLIFFIVVLFLNLYGLVPMSFSYTSIPSVTLGFGFMLWMGGYIYCLYNNYEHCVAHFLPLGTPQVLQIVLVWIEFLS